MQNWQLKKLQRKDIQFINAMELRYVCLDWFERGKELFPMLKVSGSQL
jgi:hypothetical protein